MLIHDTYRSSFVLYSRLVQCEKGSIENFSVRKHSIYELKDKYHSTSIALMYLHLVLSMEKERFISNSYYWKYW